MSLNKIKGKRYAVATLREEAMKLYGGDVLVFYIDETRELFDLEDY